MTREVRGESWKLLSVCSKLTFLFVLSGENCHTRFILESTAGPAHRKKITNLAILQVLKTMRRVVPKVPLLRNLLPAFNYVPDSTRPALPSTIPPITNPICVTRTICSGLMFPSVAVFLGWALFSNSFESQIKRSLLGGTTCLLIEGALTVYHKQHTYIRHCEREILDYQEESWTITDLAWSIFGFHSVLTND